MAKKKLTPAQKAIREETLGWIEDEEKRAAEDRLRSETIVPYDPDILRRISQLPIELRHHSKRRPTCVLFHGDGLYSRGNEFLRLDGAEANVLQALVELRAATKDKLIAESGVSNAAAVLRRMKQKYSMLAEAIVFPGARGRGGYTTSITPAGRGAI